MLAYNYAIIAEALHKSIAEIVVTAKRIARPVLDLKAIEALALEGDMDSILSQLQMAGIYPTQGSSWQGRACSG